MQTTWTIAEIALRLDEWWKQLHKTLCMVVHALPASSIVKTLEKGGFCNRNWGGPALPLWGYPDDPDYIPERNTHDYRRCTFGNWTFAECC